MKQRGFDSGTWFYGSWNTERVKYSMPNSPEVSNCRKNYPPGWGNHRKRVMSPEARHSQEGSPGHRGCHSQCGCPVVCASSVRDLSHGYCWSDHSSRSCTAAQENKPPKKINLLIATINSNLKPGCANGRPFYILIKASPLRIYTKQNFVACFLITAYS